MARLSDIDRAKVWTLLDRVERENTYLSRKKLRAVISSAFNWVILSDQIKESNRVPADGLKSN